MIETKAELSKFRSNMLKETHKANKIPHIKKEREPKLTYRQQKFVNLYVETNNADLSFRQAYNILDNRNVNNRVYKLKNIDYIKQAIDNKIQERIQALGITNEYVLANIKDIVTLKQDTKDPRVVSNSLKGLDMLGKYTKLWSDNTTTNNLNINVEKLLRTVEDTEEY